MENDQLIENQNNCLERRIELNLRVARFCIQAVISISVIGFCVFEISDGERSPVYYSLISGIVGFWLPAPSVSHTHD